MPKFRKKPVVIDAVQWSGHWADKWDEIHKMGNIKTKPGVMDSNTFYIETLEGDMKVSDGDWVIKGVNGEFYPCKNDIFLKTYEAVI